MICLDILRRCKQTTVVLIYTCNPAITSVMPFGFTYHDVERCFSVQNLVFMSFEHVQNALRTPTAEKHTNDRQQHANHLQPHTIGAYVL